MFSPINQTIVTKSPEVPDFSIPALEDARSETINYRQAKITDAQKSLDLVSDISQYYINELDFSGKNALTITARTFRMSLGQTRSILVSQGAFVSEFHVEDKTHEVLPIFSLNEIANVLKNRSWLASSVVDAVMDAPMALYRKLEVFRGLVSRSIADDLAEVAEGRLTE